MQITSKRRALSTIYLMLHIKHNQNHTALGGGGEDRHVLIKLILFTDVSRSSMLSPGISLRYIGLIAVTRLERCVR